MSNNPYSGTKRRDFLAIMREISEGQLMDTLVLCAMKCGQGLGGLEGRPMPRSDAPQQRGNIVYLFGQVQQ